MKCQNIRPINVMVVIIYDEIMYHCMDFSRSERSTLQRAAWRWSPWYERGSLQCPETLIQIPRPDPPFPPISRSIACTCTSSYQLSGLAHCGQGEQGVHVGGRGVFTAIRAQPRGPSNWPCWPWITEGARVLLPRYNIGVGGLNTRCYKIRPTI